MWADNETTRDLLGFRVHADLIRSLVTNPQMLPITVGIFGDWGSGKTSVMHMLRDDLDPEKYPTGSELRKQYEHVACLYFNGWLFEGYDDAKSAILSSVLLQLKDHKRFGPRIKDQIEGLLESVNWMRLARFGFKEVAIPAALAYFSGGLTLIPALIDTVKKAAAANSTTGNDKSVIDELVKPNGKTSDPGTVRTFRERFSEMLRESDIHSLVILIDDLDRCSPQRIIDNLEAVKLFLSVERTAFVIGADRRIVRHAIATVYHSAEIQKEADEADPRTDIVDDYLEKLIQVPYRLPRLSPVEVETYMSLLFCEQHLDTELIQKVQAACETHWLQDRYRVFGYGAFQQVLGASLKDGLSQNLHFCTLSAPLITEVLKGNPRQVKRFLNAYMLRRQLADVAKLTHVQDDVLVKLMVLEYADEQLFRQLYDWQASQEGMPKQLQELELVFETEEGKAFTEIEQSLKSKWDKPAIRRWMIMDPQLRDVDLRDYFWIARDRLQSTLSKVSFVPPFVRRLFEDIISNNLTRQETAVISLKGMNAEDTTMVLDLLSRQITRHPEQKNGFDALRALVESNIPGSLQLLIDVLEKCEISRIEPAVGIDLYTLMSGRADLYDHVKPIFEKISNTKTLIGGALKSQMKK